MNIPNSDLDPTSGDGCELIVSLRDSSNDASTGRRVLTEANLPVSSLQQLAVNEHIKFLPLLMQTGKRDEILSLPGANKSGSVTTSPLNDFFAIRPVRGEMSRKQLDVLAIKLAACPEVLAAYVKPPAFPASLATEPPTNVRPGNPQHHKPSISGRGPALLTQSAFIASQTYLRAAPGGVDAYCAWNEAGGCGDKIRVIDIEGGWRFSHEALKPGSVGLLVNGKTLPDWYNHGTAVLGVVGGSKGVIGIAPRCEFGGVSIFDENGGSRSAAAITNAASNLAPGDIILIELHRPGPRYGYSTMTNQEGYVPIEWWYDDYFAIRQAVDSGIIVVAAAGNGGEYLDDPLYDTPPSGFPNHWTNPFRRGANDSGAILVGAGAPPPGTNSANHGPDRSRLSFSNFGSVIDAQGWGKEVVTSGYGDLQGGADEDRWYTSRFSGTSSAAPMVVGVLACIQGIRRAAGQPPLTPAQARNLLRTTGSSQQDGPDQPSAKRIGTRPDLRAMIAASRSIV